MRSNDRGLHWFTSHKNVVENLQALLAYEIVEALPTQHFIIKMANRLVQQMVLIKETKAAACLAALSSWKDLQSITSNTHATIPGDKLNTTQIYKVPEIVKQLVERHHKEKIKGL